MKRPESSEHAPYFKRIIDLVSEGDFFQLLEKNTQKTRDYFTNLPSEKQNYKYAEDKWTIKQVLMHLIDTERAFAYRAFVCGRGDLNTQLFKMDENLYNQNTDVSNRTVESLLAEFEAVRGNSTFLFQNLTEAQSAFLCDYSKYKISARALGYLMIGHVLHHIEVIETRYLS